MNNYSTVFDLATESYHWGRASFFGGMLLVALLVYIFFPHWPHRQQLLGWALLTGFLTGLDYLQNRWMRSKLTGGSCLAVEGIVTNYYTGQDYHPRTDINGRTVKDWYTYEGFRVNGVRFFYTVGASTSYFRNGEKPRLPIRDEMIMSIQYFAEPIIGGSPRNRILKLEIQPSTIQPRLPTTEPATATLD